MKLKYGNRRNRWKTPDVVPLTVQDAPPKQEAVMRWELLLPIMAATVLKPNAPPVPLTISGLWGWWDTSDLSTLKQSSNSTNGGHGDK